MFNPVAAFCFDVIQTNPTVVAGQAEIVRVVAICAGIATAYFLGALGNW